MKVLILVLSMNDGEHYSQFFETQKETWDSIDVDGFKTFYYFGNCLENKIVNNEIHLTVNESLFTTSKKFIESLKLIKDFDFDETDNTNFNFLDSQLAYSGSATTTISGLDHLEGQTVSVLANGATHPDRTVSGGSITLARSSTKVKVGLKYTSLLQTMRLDAGAQNGTSQAKTKRI